MIILGITGGIGSGKSLLAEIIRHAGHPVYDADARAKWVMTSQPEIRQGIIDLFGAEAYLPSGELNRPHLSQRAFGEPALLQQLNSLVHPATGRDFAAWTSTQEALGRALICKEAAILFESGAYLACDQVLSVYAPKSLRIQRVMQRDGVDESAVLARMKRQWSESEKIRRADWVVFNDGQHLLIPQVMRILSVILSSESPMR